MSPVRQAAALCEALLSVKGDARRLLAEKLFNILEDSFPGAARASASLLVAAGDAEGASLGHEVSLKLGDDPVRDFLHDYEVTRASNIDRVRHVDVLLLCIKAVELAASLRAFDAGISAQPESLWGGAEAWFTQYGGVSYAIASVGVAGNVESALKLGRLFQGVNYRIAVLVGMAAGVKGEVELGDVVVSEQVWAVDFEILRPKGPVPEPNTYSPRLSLYENMGSFRVVDPDWRARVRAEILERSLAEELPPRYMNRKKLPNFHTGVIFAGSRLIEDDSLVRRRTEQHGRLLAAEMEGAGFAAAAKELGRGDWLVVRGIADFGQPGRVKRWQFAAAYAAAALVRDAIHHRRIQLPEPQTD